MMNVNLIDVTFDRKPLKKNYTQLSNELIDEVIKKKRLSADSLTLMTVLYALYPEDERLTNFNAWMEMLGIGINRIKKAVSELASLGYIHIQKNRDQWGRFTHNSYQFYRTPSDNPYFGRQSEQESETPEKGVSSMVQNPCHGDEGIYLFNNNTLYCYCLSVYSETEKTELQTENVETVEMSVENSESLTDCITASIDEIITENGELKEKLSLIPDMHEFMQNLTETIKTALLRLKHPEARGKFIKNTIIHVLEKIKARRQAPKSTEKNLPIVDEEKAEKQAFTLWLKGKMDFEEHLQESSAEYCHFLSSVIDSLTEIVTIGRAGKRVIDGDEIREKLRLIDRIDEGLDEFADSFWYHFKGLLSQTKVRNEKRYMTAVLPDFIKGYSAGNIQPNFQRRQNQGYQYKNISLSPEQVERFDEYLQFVNRFTYTYRNILNGLSDEKQEYYRSRIPEEYFDREVPDGEPLTEKTLEDFVAMAEYFIVQEQVTGLPMEF